MEVVADAVSNSEHSLESNLARVIRRLAMEMIATSRASHIGSALGCADIIAILYCRVLNHRVHDHAWPGRDRFIMGKGHAAVALYACLAEFGYFPKRLLDGYGEDGSKLAGHVTAGALPGIEMSAGSLGHGLPQSAGMALALKLKGSAARVFCLLSDGECQEGSTWEAALTARQWGLSNLHAIIDLNGQQGLGYTRDIADLEPLVDKWRAFGWDAAQVDGHNLVDLEVMLSRVSDTPKVTIARTVKGRGVSFMEDQLKWHYRSPSAEELALALRELESP